MRLGFRWLALLALALTACQAAPPPPRPSAKSLATQAAEALQRGDAAKAADLYRAALVSDPESLPLHYGLGVATSYLDRRPDTVREFSWVVARGEPDAAETKAAREWLASVGIFPRAAVARVSDGTRAQEQDSSSRDAKAPPASLQGHVLYDTTPGVIVPMERLQLMLSDYPNRIVYLRLRTDERGNFHFKDVPPGVYKLTDAVAGPARWRLRVELKPGQDLSLDLNPTNSTRVRDDFPDSQPVGSPSS